MIYFKDFVPAQISKGKLFKSAQYDSLEKAHEMLNAWLRRNTGYTIINVETVTLPNLHSPAEEGSTDGGIRTQGHSMDIYWHQFIRVWYRK